MFDIIVYNFWMTSVLLVGTFFVLYRQAPTLVFMFAIWICIYAVIIAVFINKKIKYDLLEAAADSRVGGRLSDVFSNILTTKIFSARESEVISFQEVTNDEAKKRWKSWSMGAIQDSIQSALNFVLQAGVLLVLVKLWIQGSITVGTVVLVQTYTGIILDRLWDLGNAMTRFMKSATDMKEMIDIFEEIPDVSDPHQPGTSKMKSGEIEFKNVHFNYIKEQNVFENFNLFIPRGQRIGLVGHSGSGKTTITKLLFRFSEVSDGEILIDGQDIRSVTQDDLRRAISYVPQEPILFHRTIRENIAYGKPDATDAEIIEAAKSAHAHEFISRLVHGYDTFVGERGVKLSGGERQRVAIARAMLKPAPILILDEATSSLDSVSESYIQEALEKLMQGKTVIVIAHRLSTIQKMDRIIVLENGKIAEDGNHKELLWLGGVYAELWDHQSGGFIQ